MTGSGKTTFISKVSGRNDLNIGHDLTSCTYRTLIGFTLIQNASSVGDLTL